MHKPSAEEIQRFIAQSFPRDDRDPVIGIEAVSDQHVRTRLQVTARYLRPGASISGPIQMAMADTAGWALILHNVGLAAAPSVTSNLNMSFLSRPGPEPLIAEGTLLKLGKRLSVCEVRRQRQAGRSCNGHLRGDRPRTSHGALSIARRATGIRGKTGSAGLRSRLNANRRRPPGGVGRRAREQQPRTCAWRAMSFALGSATPTPLPTRAARSSTNA